MNIAKTERLIIRKVNNEDAKDLSKVLSDPEVMKYSLKGVHTEEQIYDYIINCQKLYEQNGFGHWVIYNNLTGEFVGICGLNKHGIDNVDLVHIVYRLAKDQQGKGYATEASSGVLDFAKNALSIDYVYALIEPENTESKKVATKIGFKFNRLSTFLGVNVEVFQAQL